MSADPDPRPRSVPRFLDDTQLEVRRRLDQRLRELRPDQKIELVAAAERTVRAAQLAGLRLRHPLDSEADLRRRADRERIGDELWRKVYGAPPLLAEPHGSQ
jgi:hypothetical protein